MCLAGLVNTFQATFDTWTADVLRSASGMMSDAWESKSLAASSFFNLGAPVAIVLTVVMWICGLISKIFAYFRAGMLPILFPDRTVSGNHVFHECADHTGCSSFFPVIIGYSCYFYSRIGKRFQDADEAEGALSSIVQENLTGVRVVRAFGREKYEIDRFDEKNNAYSNLWVYLGKLMSVYWASGDLITNLQVLVVMVTGVAFAVNGQITLGEFMAFISYNASLTWPVRSLGRIISDMSKAGVSMERVAYILEAEEEDAAVKCEAKSTDRNENAENIAKKEEGRTE